MNYTEIISVSLILFSVIDIIGSIPVIIDLKNREFSIHSGKASIIAMFLMISFLFLGLGLLKLFHLDVKSFSVAGSIIIFLIGMEMILGRNIFKDDPTSKSGTIVPVAFPLIAGAGTMTTIISLKSQFDNLSILIGIILNTVLVYIVLKSANKISAWIGPGGISIFRKVFGIILLAIAIKMFQTNFHLVLGTVPAGK